MGIASDFVLIVVAGLLGGIAARLLRLPLLIGYVAAGIAVGPHTAGPKVGQIHDIETLAEIGVALLLFSVGLEVSFRDLGRVRRFALLGGLLQIVLTAGGAMLAAIHGLGLRPVDALWFGAMISVSSTMVVLKILAGAGVTSTLASRAMIGILLVQDLAVIPMLIVLPQAGAPDNLVWRVSGALAAAAGLIAAVFIAGTRVMPALLRKVLDWGPRELFLVAVVAAGVGTGYAMSAAGLSFALGAFVAGLILSQSEFSHQALSDIVPLRDIFGLLFFVSVGMLFDPGYALANAGLIASVVAAILAGKALILGILARIFGYRNMAPWIIGFGLSQIGEFSFVLGSAGLSAGLLSKPVYDLALAAAILTMALSPAVSAAALPVGRTWKRWFGAGGPVPPSEPDDANLTGHVIVGGYGRTGRAVAGVLKEARIPCLVVESDYGLITELRGNGLPGLWGDVERPEILQAARVEEARMLLLTVPNQKTVDTAVQWGRRLNPQLVVVARGTRVQDVRRLREMGVLTVQPEFEGGLEMIRAGLLRCGHPEAGVGSIIHDLRAAIYEVRES